MEFASAAVAAEDELPALKKEAQFAPHFFFL
jgi:hypothetical protein